MTIAVRYGALRSQFGPPDAPEVAVLDYPSQQLKLMPMLATAYTLHFAKGLLISKYAEAKRTKDEAAVADVHALSAGLKAYTTAYTNTALSVCREACGGHGCVFFLACLWGWCVRLYVCVCFRLYYLVHALPLTARRLTPSTHPHHPPHLHPATRRSTASARSAPTTTSSRPLRATSEFSCFLELKQKTTNQPITHRQLPK